MIWVPWKTNFDTVCFDRRMLLVSAGTLVVSGGCRIEGVCILFWIDFCFEISGFLAYKQCPRGMSIKRSHYRYFWSVNWPMRGLSDQKLYTVRQTRARKGKISLSSRPNVKEWLGMVCQHILFLGYVVFVANFCSVWTNMDSAWLRFLCSLVPAAFYNYMSMEVFIRGVTTSLFRHLDLLASVGTWLICVKVYMLVFS